MNPGVLLCAWIVDGVAGDPRWFPHPVIYMGKLVRFFQTRIRNGIGSHGNKKRGIILWCGVVVPVYCITWAIVAAGYHIHYVLGSAVTIVLSWLTLATRSLYNESRLVMDALALGDIREAQKRLSMIVGRDTKHLDEKTIHRAVIETVQRISRMVLWPPCCILPSGERRWQWHTRR